MKLILSSMLRASRATPIVTFFACAVSVILILLSTAAQPENIVHPFRGEYAALNDCWTITDSAGVSRAVAYPFILEYGADGQYTLEATLPAVADISDSPSLMIYSNYIDIIVYADGERLYEYPYAQTSFYKGTGNTYHFVRIDDFVGKKISITISCQLGDAITYQLDAPIIGSKSAILYSAIARSAPAIVIASCMLILSLMMISLYFALRKRLSLDYSTMHLALFTLTFAIYVYLETPLAKLFGPSGYTVYVATFIALSLMPTQLLSMFKRDVDERLEALMYAAIGISFLNCFAQLALHFGGLSNFRSMLPITHITIIVSIAIAALALLLSDRRSRPLARTKLVSALPMVAGGCADITLLWLNTPSFNNSLWFVLGVTVFIIIQFVGFIQSYFRTQQLAIEGKLLRDMAYTDALSNLGNRNAYELRLKELSERESAEGLGCIVADINRLKYINDTYGHHMGDTAISETGRILRRLAPERCACFRTGGDEFVLLTDGIANEAVFSLASALSDAVKKRGDELNAPFTLAVGCGCYVESDGNIQDFVRRVDTLMYLDKRGCPPVRALERTDA